MARLFRLNLFMFPGVKKYLPRNVWAVLNTFLAFSLGVLAIGWGEALWRVLRSPAQDPGPAENRMAWVTAKGVASIPNTRRNIFSPLNGEPSPRPRTPTFSTPPPPPKIPLAERAGHLRLVGILPGQPPQAVVEDPRAQKTFTVSAGQMLGDYNVAEVRDSGVVLSFEDERFELTL